MRRLRRGALALGLIPLGLASSAYAADATPEQAQALERQLRDWMASLLGPSVPLSNRPIRMVPDGDHYRVEVPIGSGTGPAAAPPTLTANARLQDGGIWSIDQVRLPVPAQFTLSLPQPPKGGAAAPGPSSPIDYTVAMAQQSGQMTFDPNWKTPATVTTSFGGLDIKAVGPDLQQLSRADQISSTSTLRPVGPDRVDVLSSTLMEGYTVSTKSGDVPPFDVSFKRIRASGEMTSVSRDQATKLLQTMTAFFGAAMAAGPAAKAPPLDPEMAKAVLLAFQDLATGITLDEVFEGIGVSVGGMSGGLQQAALGFGAKADEGMLTGRMDLGLQGLTLPDLGLGPMTALIPSKVAIRPVVSGIAVADLVRLINASGDKRTPSQADIAALFSHGGIRTGVESFTLDVAGSSFTGNARVLVSSPERFSGEGQIAVSNLDALQQRVSAIPDLAQAVPVFIFAKGVARTVDNRLVWDIAYRDGKLLVNNQDLSAMMGGAAPAPTPPQPQQQRNQPQRQQQQQQRPPQNWTR